MIYILIALDFLISSLTPYNVTLLILYLPFFEKKELKILTLYFFLLATIDYRYLLLLIFFYFLFFIDIKFRTNFITRRVFVFLRIILYYLLFIILSYLFV